MDQTRFMPDKLNNMHLLYSYASYRSCWEIYTLLQFNNTYKPDSDRYAAITRQGILIHTRRDNDNLSSTDRDGISKIRIDIIC